MIKGPDGHKKVGEDRPGHEPNGQNRDLLKIRWLQLGYGWAIFGLQSKMPTLSGHLLTVQTAILLVARL